MIFFILALALLCIAEAQIRLGVAFEPTGASILTKYRPKQNEYNVIALQSVANRDHGQWSTWTKTPDRHNIKRQYQGLNIKLLGGVLLQEQRANFFTLAKQDCQKIISEGFDGILIEATGSQIIQKESLERYTDQARRTLGSKRLLIHAIPAHWLPDANIQQFVRWAGPKTDYFIIKYCNRYQFEWLTFMGVYMHSVSLHGGHSAIKKVSVNLGIPMQKLIVGKTANPNDRGFIESEVLREWRILAKEWELTTSFAIEGMEYDLDGAFVKRIYA